jgi:hypothetical protein
VSRGERQARPQRQPAHLPPLLLALVEARQKVSVAPRARVMYARRRAGAPPRTCALSRRTQPRSSCRAARASGCGAPQPPPARPRAALSTRRVAAPAPRAAAARTRSSAGRASMRPAACAWERAAGGDAACARRHGGWQQRARACDSAQERRRVVGGAENLQSSRPNAAATPSPCRVRRAAQPQPPWPRGAAS